MYLHSSIDDQISNLSIAGTSLKYLIEEVQDLYLEDQRPWVVGYSGGKDSTAVLQIVFTAVRKLSSKQRRKKIYVISSDTLVETPLVVALTKKTLSELNRAAKEFKIPLYASQVTPKPDSTFWVNLLGRGYSAPTQTFRWCTERMKINPVSEFIRKKVSEFGEVIVVLGSRSQESASRAQVINRHRVQGTNLARHTSLPNAFVYMPIVNWSSDEVWEYLMSAPNPWGGDNNELLDLYRGSNSGECPIVIDTSTPSCGKSRFGCWTCTVVSKDHAMESLVVHSASWMQPLLDFRNMLAETTRPEKKSIYRNHRRRTGKVSLARALYSKESSDKIERKHVPGPYLMKYRREWLEKLLQIEKNLQDEGYSLELISNDELHLIRQQWLSDPNEPDWDDSLPKIYLSVYGYELDSVDSTDTIGNSFELDLLGELSERNNVPSVLVAKLLELQLSMDGLPYRRGLHERIDTLLSQDWEDIESVVERKETIANSEFSDQIEFYESELDKLNGSNLE